MLSILLLVSLPSLSLAAQEAQAFVPTPKREAIPRAPRAFPRGDEYEIEGERLVRVRGGERLVLDCTDPEGTGEIRALESRGAGTLWVAAERGLYCTSTEVDALDDVRLRDGAPSGAPVGAVFDEAGRLWLATEEGFGPIEPRQGFGRSFTSGDGLPAPPFEGLYAAKDGSLLLVGAEGVHRYHPDSGAPPAVRVLSVNGAAFDPDARFDLGVGGVAELELEGDALGGASFRYRLEGHHLWRALDAPTGRVEPLEPGEHEIEVVALDRDLGRSPPVIVRVRVPVPWYFRTKVLLAGAAAALVLLIGGALWNALRTGGGITRIHRALLSAVLAFVVGLQVLGGVVPHARSWPIIGFAMYSDRYEARSYAYQLNLYALNANGRRIPIRPWDSGYGQFELARDMSDVVYGDEATRREWLQRWNERNQPKPPYTGFLIQDERFRLTVDGPVEVAPVVFCVFPDGALDATR